MLGRATSAEAGVRQNLSCMGMLLEKLVFRVFIPSGWGGESIDRLKAMLRGIREIIQSN